jgi:hypothetical protein
VVNKLLVLPANAVLGEPIDASSWAGACVAGGLTIDGLLHKNSWQINGLLWRLRVRYVWGVLAAEKNSACHNGHGDVIHRLATPGRLCLYSKAHTIVGWTANLARQVVPVAAHRCACDDAS